MENGNPKGAVSLKTAIRALPVETVRLYYQKCLEDGAETDAEVRRLAKMVLSESAVEGNSYGVPTIEEIVKDLVITIQELNSHKVLC